MLILSRKLNERIMIGDQIEISVLDIKGDQVKIGIQAPRSVKVYRQEVYQAIQRENIEAVKAKPDRIPHLDNILDQAQSAKPLKEDSKNIKK
jgi:carbon storage regulator